jgi:ribosomal protein L33
MTRKNLSAARKTCRGTALYTTNKTQTDLGLKPGIRGERPLQLSKVDLTRYWITHAYVQLECQQVRLDVSYQRHNYTNHSSSRVSPTRLHINPQQIFK